MSKSERTIFQPEQSPAPEARQGTDRVAADRLLHEVTRSFANRADQVIASGSDGLTVAQRQAAMNSARASVALEGLTVSPEGQAIQQRWVDGEISINECIAEIKNQYPNRKGRRLS